MNDAPNIVFICLDTARKDVYDEQADKLAERANIRFEEMRAMSSWSVPSHVGMFTGQFPHETDIHAGNEAMDKIVYEDTWLSDLDEYTTFGVSANVYASPAFGFDNLFDEFDSVSKANWFRSGLNVQKHIRDRETDGIDRFIDFGNAVLESESIPASIANGFMFKLYDLFRGRGIRRPFDYGAKRIMDSVEARLQSDDGPVFAFTNIMDVHGPHEPFRGLDPDMYTCPPSFTTLEYSDWDVSLADGISGYKKEVRWLRELYSAEMDYVDRVLAQYIDRIQAQTDRDTVFIITGDHGENLGYEAEDYMLNHAASLSEALLHVPFDIILDGSSSVDDQVIEGIRSHDEIGSIIDALRHDTAIPDRDKENRVKAEIAGCGTSLPDEDREYWNRAQRAVYDPDTNQKFVRDQYQDDRVFNVSGRPCWQYETDVPSDPDHLFQDNFGDWVTVNDEKAEEHELSEDLEGQLEDLGYM